MSDVKLQDWPEGVKLRITYGHDKDEPCAITSYAGKWYFFEPVSIEIEPHPEGFYVPALDYDRQAAEITRLRARVAELENALRFYADPFKYTDIHGDDVRVPHFYSETDFGETARVALGLDEPWSLQP